MLRAKSGGAVAGTTEVKRLFWSTEAGAPVVETQKMEGLPIELQLGPAELVVLTATVVDSDASATCSVVDEHTYYSSRVS